MKITMVHFGMLAGMVLSLGTAAAQTADQPISGTGTVNYVPKYKGTYVVGNSQIVDNGTKVGIGTGSMTPRAKLDVWAGQVTVTGSGKNGTLVLDTVGGTSLIGTNTNTNGIAITVNGNVGIGTTAPVFKLDVTGSEGIVGRLYGTATQATALQLGNKNSSTAWNVAAGGSNGWSNNNFVIDEHNVAQRLVIKPGGNVGIGTAAPSEKLQVNGNVKANNFYMGAAARQKNDILPLDNAAGRLDCLSGVSYRAKGAKGGEESQIGLIGEDVEACFPELVATDVEGEKTIDYARLVVPLIEAAKEQQLINQELEARLARIEARVK